MRRCLLFVILVTSVLSAHAGDAGPNILLIFADDVGTDAIGCYGGQSHPTPHIDSIASAGIKFNHCYAMPVCHPSRICLMTGKYPFRFGAAGKRWGGFPEEAESETISHEMKRLGYRTAVAGKWQLCMMKDDPMHPGRLGFDRWMLFGWHEGARYNDPLLYVNGQQLESTEGRFGPDEYVEFLVDFMEDSKRGNQPFFAYYPMALCHDVTNDLKDQTVPFYTDNRWMTYAEMISAMDDRIGRLLDELDRLDLAKNTLVLFVTDNGTAASSFFDVNENGVMQRRPVFNIQDGEVVRGGKGRLLDTGTRVPMLARWPGEIAEGTVTDAMVDLTDLLPTVVEIGGGKKSSDSIDGKSYADLLSSKLDGNRRRTWVYLGHRGRQAIRSHQAKLYSDGKFFDMLDDPAELNPILPTQLGPNARKESKMLRETLDHLLTESVLAVE